MKKILCLVLATVMLFSAVSTGVVASAGVEVSAERPTAVSDVIDPIYTDANTAFANSINELGYAGVNKNTDKAWPKKIVTDSPFLGANSLGASEITFSNFLANNSDDKMFGVSYDFLYSKDTSTFLWNYLDYKLQPETRYDSVLIELIKEEQKEEQKKELIAGGLVEILKKAERTKHSDLNEVEFETWWEKNGYTVFEACWEKYKYDGVDPSQPASFEEWWNGKGETKGAKVTLFKKDSRVQTKYSVFSKIFFGTAYDAEKDFDKVNSKVTVFESWASGLGRAYTVHDIEIYAANASGKKTTSCSCKTRYDACAAVLAGYDYAYENKTADQTLFAGIVEKKVYFINPFTNKEEVHYEYAYKLEKGDFGLMRANSNNQLVKVIRTIWGDGAIFATPKKATENAIKFVNFIGNLVNESFTEVESGTYKPFANKVRVTRDEFFEEVAVSSGLADILQAKWCNAKGFDVRRIMSAFGVNVDSETILDSELTKGNKMGRRILADMYTDFFADPVGYVTRLVQLFCKNYDAYYAKAFKELFSVKFRYMMELSSANTSDNLPSYTGSELDTVDGLMGFIADCAYVMDGNLYEPRFAFAPLPAKRFASAKDTNELYVYVLCYLELNRIYNDNAAMITNFINNSINKFQELYFPSDSEKRLDDIKAVKIVFDSMFNGKLTFAEIFTIHVGLFTQNTIDNFSNNFFSTIKQAIANFFQNFLTAIDKIMNSLFGWLG